MSNLSPIMKALVDAAHEEAIKKMRWRGKDGGMRMASKRQRRNMRIINAGGKVSPIGVYGGRGTRGLNPDVDTVPNRMMGADKVDRRMARMLSRVGGSKTQRFASSTADLRTLRGLSGWTSRT